MAADIVSGSGPGAKDGEPTHPRNTKRQYFPELQGIRAIAVLAVIIVHAGLTAGQLELGFMNYRPSSMAFAVVLERFTRESLPILFALSGFLLYRPFALNAIADAKKPDLGAYAWRRTLRIVPAFWLVAIIMMLTIGRDMVTGFWFAVKVLLMQHAWQGAIPSGLESTWSMTTEVAFYVFLPPFAWLAAKFARRTADPAGRARRILVLIGLLILIGYAFSVWTHRASLPPWSPDGQWPPAWIGYLAVGMALATLSAAAETSPNAVLGPYRLVAKYPGWCWGAALIVTILFCFSPVGGQGTADYPTVANILFDQPIDLLLVFLLMAPLTVPGVRSKALNTVLTVKPLQFIGKISYGMFLWHIPFLYFWAGGLLSMDGTFPNYPLTLVIVLGGSFLAALVSYYLVEKPALRLRNTFGKASSQPSMPVLTSTT
ncbi:acyltransferase family protein [Planotetraspora sp. GP83]|uniref:acyltransferase family protein n=1 Tax=Planotetraspora sp. GP83 TaxID=3156264 RepID=UPI0035163541